MKLSIIMPAYNEKSTILKIIDKVKMAKTLGLAKEIIIVDDFSTDGTRDILRKVKDKKIKILYHDINKGKGSAIRTGLKQATGDILLIQDADLEYDPNDYEKLQNPKKKGNPNVLCAFKFGFNKKTLKKM